MAFRVLKSWEENLRARQELARSRLGYWPHRHPTGLSGLLRGVKSIPVGDLNKSWDVYLTLSAIREHIAPEDHVVDLGAYASEMLCVLASAGYTQLTGIDLNPLIRFMPFSDRVKWKRGDMHRTGLASGSVSAAVAISSIEHGHYLPVLREASRLLKPGGLFVGSTDYWPEKISTDGIVMFSLPWKIFSIDDVVRFFDDAAALGLHPCGAIETASGERCAFCSDRLYTFGWFMLRKVSEPLGDRFTSQRSLA